MREGMTIGRLAKAAGVNVETIRYYQRRGLIDEPAKPPGGQRRYDSRAVVARLGFIRRAQQLGFSLEEVKTLIRLAAGAGRGAEARALCERKYAELGRRIEQLNAMRRSLRLHIARSARAKPGERCPILAALSAA